MECDRVIQLLYNDGCTAARRPYPCKGIVNAYYAVPVALLLVCLQHAGERSVPRWQAAKTPPEQLKMKKSRETAFSRDFTCRHPLIIGRYCTGKPKDVGTPVRRSPRALHSFLPFPTCCYSGCARMFSSMITSMASAGGAVLPCLLDPFCFLFACHGSVSAAVCSVLACYVLLVGASVADATMPAGECVLATELVDSCLRPLPLPPSSRVARR
jgi:hypothetical protein